MHVFHGADDGEWKRELYEQGILRQDDLKRLWTFAPLEAVEEAMGDISAFRESLMRALIQLDMVVEHSGPVSNQAHGLSPVGYYLVPEVWTRRLKGLDGAECTAAQREPNIYKARQHFTMGTETSVNKGLVSIFFRKFLCKCVNDLIVKEAVRRDGRMTLGANLLPWESSAWPAGSKALVV